MSTNTIYVEGLSLLGPGLTSWEAAQPILRGETPFSLAPVSLSAPAALPPTERRRAGAAIKLSMAIGLAAIEHAGANAATLANVFSSTGGDCDNCHNLLETLASDDRMVSPTRFHNSVHNAPAGYWGIAMQCTAASTSLCAYDATFGAGLIESATQALDSGEPSLLIAFDTAYPEPLYSMRPIPHPFGVGLVLTPHRSARSRAALRFSLSQAQATPMDDPALESLRQTIPSARSLPLLQRLAQGRPGVSVLSYLDDCQLAVEVLA